MAKIHVVVIVYQDVVNDVMAFKNEDDAIKFWEKETGYSWKDFSEAACEHELPEDFDDHYDGSNIYEVDLN